jgi:hypothetical protein
MRATCAGKLPPSAAAPAQVAQAGITTVYKKSLRSFLLLLFFHHTIIEQLFQVKPHDTKLSNLPSNKSTNLQQLQDEG